MLESVLIANRGEIAVRIVRACRDAGIRSIAVYSDGDREAEHVRLADEAVHLGPAGLRDSYLSIDKLIHAAKVTGAAAVHPGYGLLAENAEFAERVIASGLIFVGPSAEVIASLADKRAAREHAQAAGLSVLPGRALGHGDDAAALGANLGYPLLVKAAFGGGGRGMRAVGSPEELPDAVTRAASESLAAFGRGEVYLESQLPRARHVEVQVLSDKHGNIRHLGTRDCTIQRRNQKLLEEAPAVGLDPGAEARAVAGSVELVRRVGYHGAATVEFLVDPATGEFFFIEVNTRLQVEHTVTEMITGVDIVVAQLAIASGEPVGFAQDDLRLSGHAIQARINAEDPSAGFLPQTGRIDGLRLPSGPWVRTDAGVGPGEVIGPYYDSMLAKITAYGPDRDTARVRLARALAETVVVGVPTNVAFLARVLDSHDFRNNSHWTAMVDAGAIEIADIPASPRAAGTGSYRSVRLRTSSDELLLDIPIPLGIQPNRRATTGDRAAAGTGMEYSTGGVAPMDGVLVRHTVRVGDSVGPDTTVAVVESMKMETHVVSGKKGVVVAIHGEAGASVRRGERLVTVAEDAG